MVLRVYKITGHIDMPLVSAIRPGDVAQNFACLHPISGCNKVVNSFGVLIRESQCFAEVAAVDRV